MEGGGPPHAGQGLRGRRSIRLAAAIPSIDEPLIKLSKLIPSMATMATGSLSGTK
jgi:hypothetical protein